MKRIFSYSLTSLLTAFVCIHGGYAQDTLQMKGCPCDTSGETPPPFMKNHGDKGHEGSRNHKRQGERGAKNNDRQLSGMKNLLYAHHLMREKYDTNKDGKLDKSEMQILRGDAERFKKEMRDSLLAKYDTNQNGKIDPDEQVAMRQQVLDQFIQRELKVNPEFIVFLNELNGVEIKKKSIPEDEFQMRDSVPETGNCERSRRVKGQHNPNKEGIMLEIKNYILSKFDTDKNGIIEGGEEEAFKSHYAKLVEENREEEGLAQMPLPPKERENPPHLRKDENDNVRQTPENLDQSEFSEFDVPLEQRGPKNREPRRMKRGGPPQGSPKGNVQSLRPRAEEMILMLGHFLIMEKFDLNKDGKLSNEERKLMKEDRKTFLDSVKNKKAPNPPMEKERPGLDDEPSVF